jgi:LPXTG-site transpeptidase (sortase) family protein
VLVTTVAFAALIVRSGNPVSGPAAASDPLDAATARAAAWPPPAGDPVRLRIPALAVNAPLVPLGLNDDGTLEVPRYHDAGWFSGASRPGHLGPAVVAAHLDSTTGPDIFYRLKDLKRGDLVHIDYPDGTVTFAVREARSFAKTSFPTGQVYGSTAGPELRLVTCGGTYDRKSRSYSSNLVVWANLAPRR